MKKTLFFIIILITILSCKDNDKPKNLIKKNQMVDLLFDMHIANKTRNIKTLDKKTKSKDKYFSGIYEKYQIDSTRFKTSHKYYMLHIDQYREIYSEVEDRIGVLLKKQDNLVNKTDSIKKAEKKKKDTTKIIKKERKK
jgi:hypothetical protein